MTVDNACVHFMYCMYDDNSEEACLQDNPGDGGCVEGTLLQDPRRGGQEGEGGQGQEEGLEIDGDD